MDQLLCGQNMLFGRGIWGHLDEPSWASCIFDTPRSIANILQSHVSAVSTSHADIPFDGENQAVARAVALAVSFAS